MLKPTVRLTAELVNNKLSRVVPLNSFFHIGRAKQKKFHSYFNKYIFQSYNLISFIEAQIAFQTLEDSVMLLQGTCSYIDKVGWLSWFREWCGEQVYELWFKKIEYCEWRIVCFSSLIRQSLHLLGGEKWSFLFLTYCLSYTNELYMIIIFPNSFIFDAILLRY